MRIAYVCADRGVPVFGLKGSSVHAQEVLSALVRAGHEVELFATEIGGQAPAILGDVTVHRVPSQAGSDPESRELAALGVNEALHEALSRAPRGRFDCVLERHSLWSYAAMEFARAQGIAALLEVNAPLLQEQRRYRSLIREHDAEGAVARAYAAATDLLAVSAGVAAHLNRHPAVRGRVHIVPNGVDPLRFRPDHPPAPLSGRAGFTVGFVGGLRPWHGVDDLLFAFAALQCAEPGAGLLIVGDGPMRSELEAMAGELGLAQAATFTGAVEPAEVPGLLSAMDVAVAPYPPMDDFYFSPLKVYEYMASGRAVVAASIGQINEVLVDGETGLLYPPGDARALADALIRLHRDPGLRQRLGVLARQTAVRDHSWDKVAHTIIQIARMSAPAPAIAQRVG